ncbi:MAG TPA: inositol monophosphatase family protein [Pyrinomonadaceae bacterium]|nr:inositol monophosphatase family protein [Pyrinomonadaceae bacterium]
MNDLKDLLAFAVELAHGAGEITLRYFRKQPETSTKSDGSYITIADRQAEEYLRKQVAERFPNDGFLGEEQGESRGRSGRRWIVDPIDGTFAFVHGVPFYGVLIALEIDEELVAGVVNMPALREIVSAAKGLGCFFNGEPARVSTTAKLDDALLLATEFSACAELLQARAKTSRTWGDCYGYVLVATGRADVMLDPVMNLWDCAPLLPIMEEAGGTFTDWCGVRTADGGNAIATNGILFDEVMSVIGHQA